MRNTFIEKMRGRGRREEEETGDKRGERRWGRVRKEDRKMRKL